ncbi:Phosphoserine phosphatase [Mycoemilia scoparia]|uniref:phosphoserine phosphatase n=1 Tax=Mycoemilia scoparia TaxID=417184 RepID=A0A9W8A6X3_9FUNG|nr:Phosphoserine phosphatase [Mycoemilia scoparia]
MKYGQYLEEQLADFPKHWQDHFISYSKLKGFIKDDMSQSTIDTSSLIPKDLAKEWSLPDDEAHGGRREPSATQPLDQLLGERMHRLAELTPKFCHMLTEDVDRMSKCYYIESKKLCEEGKRALKDLKMSKIHKIEGVSGVATPISMDEWDELQLVLEGILLLERYAFLNYTAIAKILKKHDKWTGICIREAYMMRTSKMPFVQNEPLLDLKGKIMTALSGATVESSGKEDDHLNKALNSPSHLNLQAFLAEKEMLREGHHHRPETPKSAHFPRNITELDSRLDNQHQQQALEKGQVEGESIAEPNLSDFLDRTQTVTITLRGPHGTDIIGAVLDSCTQFRCRVLDFSLSRFHHHVSFGVVVKIPAADIGLFNHLSANAQKWDATLTFDVQNAKLRAKQLAYGTKYRLDEAPYDGRTKYIATVVNEQDLTPGFLNEWCKWLLVHKISIERMRRLDSFAQLRCVEFALSVPSNLSLHELRRELFALSSRHNTDVALQPDNVFRRQKRLVVFDMDSTLIQQEVIDEIARCVGVVDKVAEITESAMRGELDFTQSLKARVALLKNAPADTIDKVKESLVFTKGAKNLCLALKRLGFKLAVISGGFQPLAEYVKRELGLDYAFANQLETTPDGKYLTGRTCGPIVNAERKAELLDVLAQAEGISPKQVVAVGDGANDLKMLAKASLGIAFNAKPRVQQQARTRINQTSLVNVLYLMGYSETEAKELYK